MGLRWRQAGEIGFRVIRDRSLNFLHPELEGIPHHDDEAL